MCSERDSDILDLIERLKNGVRLARKHSLDHTVNLLQMATLDLQMILHSISDDELRQFADALDDATLPKEWANLC